MGSGLRTDVGRTPAHIGSNRHADRRRTLENPLAATLTNARGLYDMCLPTRTGGYVVELTQGRIRAGLRSRRYRVGL